VNASPEPFSNWGLSFGEEASVAGLLYLVVAHPVASIGVAAAALLCGTVAMLWIGRSIARLFARNAEPIPPRD
jgi:membrane protein YqaA with SNARE-associated domain